MTAAQRKRACEHLRQTAYHKLKSWDESLKAENLVGCDIDTGGEHFDEWLAACANAEEVLTLSDDEILGFFEETQHLTEKRSGKANNTTG